MILTKRILVDRQHETQITIDDGVYKKEELVAVHVVSCVFFWYVSF